MSDKTPGKATRSVYELGMISLLKSSRKPLSMNEITQRLIEKSLVTPRGKTPEKTLYSIVSKNEKKRIERGQKCTFSKRKIDGVVKYSLNK